MNEQLLPGVTLYAKDRNGIECTIHVNPSGQTMAEVMRQAAELSAAAKKEGFTRSERLEPRAFGGGGAAGGGRPEVKAPDCVKVPEHDGQPMRFVPAKGNTGPHFDCRKGKGCSEPNDRGFAHTVWKMDPAEGFTADDVKAALFGGQGTANGAKPAETKPATKAAAGAARANTAATQPSAAKPDSKRLTEFWTAVLGWGFRTELVQDVARNQYQSDVAHLSLAQLVELEADLIRQAQSTEATA